MITPEMLGRAHGALATMKPTDAGSVILRDLVAAIEGSVPSGGRHVLTVPAAGPPLLMYVSNGSTVNLGEVDPDHLRRWSDNEGRVELRFIQALLDHASEVVAKVLNPPSTSAAVRRDS